MQSILRVWSTRSTVLQTGHNIIMITWSAEYRQWWGAWSTTESKMFNPSTQSAFSAFYRLFGGSATRTKSSWALRYGYSIFKGKFRDASFNVCTYLFISSSPRQKAKPASYLWDNYYLIVSITANDTIAKVTMDVMKNKQSAVQSAELYAQALRTKALRSSTVHDVLLLKWNVYSKTKIFNPSIPLGLLDLKRVKIECSRSSSWRRILRDCFQTLTSHWQVWHQLQLKTKESLWNLAWQSWYDVQLSIYRQPEEIYSPVRSKFLQQPSEWHSNNPPESWPGPHRRFIWPSKSQVKLLTTWTGQSSSHA